MNVHKTKYTFGDTVYLKTDPEQLPRIVIAFTIRPGGVVYYEIGQGASSSFHFDIEMSSQEDESVSWD